MRRYQKFDGFDIVSYLLYVFSGFMSNNTLMMFVHYQISAAPRSDSDITPRSSVYYLLLIACNI